MEWDIYSYRLLKKKRKVTEERKRGRMGYLEYGKEQPNFSQLVIY